MKKLTALTCVILICVLNTFCAYASNTAKISVSGNLATVSFSCSENDRTTAAKSIKKLLEGLNDDKSGSFSQKITVQCTSDTEIAFSLRLEKPQNEPSGAKPARITPEPKLNDDNALDYYNIKIKDKDGKTVYNSAKEKKTDGVALYKDIELKPIKTGDEEYDIEVSKNSALKAMADEARELDWLITADAHNKNAGKNPPEAVILSKGSYTVGGELAAARYEISGNSKVKVYTAENELKTNIILSKDGNGGVKSYVMTIEDGETIEVSADTEIREFSGFKAEEAEENSAPVLKLIVLFICIAALILAAAAVFVYAVVYKRQK